MSTPPSPHTPSRRSLWVLIGTCCALLAVGALTLWAGWLSFDTIPAAQAPASEPRPEAAQSHPSADQQSNAAQSASSNADAQDTATPEIPTALDTAFTRMSQVLAAPQDAPDASDILADNALEELNAARSEWEFLGYRQEGDPTISDIQVTQPTDDATRRQALVCVDFSSVQIIAEDGSPIIDDDAPTRSRLLVDLELIDGTWKVTNQSFPDDPEC